MGRILPNCTGPGYVRMFYFFLFLLLLYFVFVWKTKNNKNKVKKKPCLAFTPVRIMVCFSGILFPASASWFLIPTVLSHIPSNRPSPPAHNPVPVYPTTSLTSTIFQSLCSPVVLNIVSDQLWGLWSSPFFFKSTWLHLFSSISACLPYKLLLALKQFCAQNE